MKLKSKNGCWLYCHCMIALLCPGVVCANGTGSVPVGKEHLQAVVGPFAAPPQLSSRPTASHVLYIDFDGANIGASTSREWNCGLAFTANPSGLTLEQMLEVYEVAKEDYLPFNVDVTTIESRYTGASPLRRMRCIVTPTDAWVWITALIDPKGGIAKIDSFGRADGVQYASDVPCFAFIGAFDAGRPTTNTKELGTNVSHELGHTLGLTHDGWTAKPDDYFPGLGPQAGPMPHLWSPIMGNGTGLLTQWDNGEYADYSSLQTSPIPGIINAKDDIAIIANTGVGGNGFGFASDDHGNASISASPISTNGGMTANGNIGRVSATLQDEDWFTFTFTDTKALKLVVAPAEPFTDSDPIVRFRRNVGIANLNPRVELYRQGQTAPLADVRGSNNVALPAGYTAAEQATIITEALRVRINQTLTAGTYFLRITGVGFGSPATDGYSNYGSLGAYSIDGTLYAPLTVTSGSSASGAVATPFTPFQLSASGTYTSWSAIGLPPGLTLEKYSGLITGTPTVANTYNATVTVEGNGGPGTRSMAFVIAPGSAISDATETPTLAWSFPTGFAQWFIQSTTTKDTVDAAQAAHIGDNESAAMETQVTGPGTISFWWKVSSELNTDTISFLVDSVVQPGGVWSGDRSWAQKTYQIGTGTHTLRWVYSKDYLGNNYLDSAWVDQIVWNETLTITGPISDTCEEGQPYTSQIVATGGSLTYGVSGAKIPGLDVNAQTGAIFGTPTTPGPQSMILTAANGSSTATQVFSLTVNPSPPTALDNTLLAFNRPDAKKWFGQKVESWDGVDSMQSPALNHSESSTLETTVAGPGTINYYWKTNSEIGDILSLRIGANTVDSVSGSTGWVSRTQSVPAGVQTLRWTFTRNASGDGGSNSVWLDRVSFTGATGPTITSPLTVNWTAGQGYNVPLTSDDPATVWSVSASIPTWVFLTAPHSNTISAIPNRSGTFSFPIFATNSLGTTTRVFTMYIQSSYTAFAVPFGLGAGSELGDQDKDGLNNFAEFALVLNPFVRNNGYQPVSYDPVTKRLRAVFKIRIGGSRDIKYEVQVSSNLQTWTSIAEGYGDLYIDSLGAQSVSTTDGVQYTVVDGVAQTPATPKRWMRVKVSQMR